MYDVFTIADYIVDTCNKNKSVISNLKLQRMLYLIQGKFLAEKGEGCFDEIIQAREFGPVIPEVYRQYRIYGAAQIPSKRRVEPFNISQVDKMIINNTVNEYADYSAFDLYEYILKHQIYNASISNDRKSHISNEELKKIFSMHKDEGVM